MLRSGSLSHRSARTVSSGSNRNIIFPGRPVLPCVEQSPSCGQAQLTTQPREAQSGPVLCRATQRKGSERDISDMNMAERLERLDQLSGRVGEMRSVFDRESMLRDMGAMDTDVVYEPPKDEDYNKEEYGFGKDEEVFWLPWVADARTHVVTSVVTEPLPDGLQQRLVLTADVEEDATVVQVPLHNCLVLYVCEDGMATERLSMEYLLEREGAEEVFVNMQTAFLDRWSQFHGPMPPALAEMLCDFSIDAPNARAKMALWLLWVAECCDSPYWRQALGALPPTEAMPHLEFSDEGELTELQWWPYELPAGVRRQALKAFYDGFATSPLAKALGFQPLQPKPPGDDGDGEDAAAAATPAPAAMATEKPAGKGRKSKAAAVDSPSPPAPAKAEAEQPLRPMPSFERFLWAYCNAEARSLGNGERIVFFPQADPCIYTTDPRRVNTTVAVVASEGPVLDEFAVLAALRPLQAGEAVYVHAPFLAGSGATSQLHTQFGLVPEPGGNPADAVDLTPETGSILDDWLKRLLNQEEATRLDSVADPGIRHLLSLAEAGENIDWSQVPPLRKVLPPLQMPRLWGPGLIAGVKRLRLEQRTVPLPEESLEELDARLAAEEQVAERAARDRGETSAPLPVPYDEYGRWRDDPTTTDVVEVPGDAGLLQTEQGQADWRRLLAAWASLPRHSPDSREYGRRVELALQGAPLDQVFLSPRDVTRELAAADTLLMYIEAILETFETTIEEDEQLLAAASGSAANTSATAQPPSRKAGGRGASRSGRSSKRSGGGSESDDEANGAAGATESAGSAAEGRVTAISTLRMRGIVAWRLEHKRVWRQMAGLVEEYRDALAAVAPEGAVEEDEAAEAVAA